jgi:hypothetical protein
MSSCAASAGWLGVTALLPLLLVPFAWQAAELS